MRERLTGPKLVQILIVLLVLLAAFFLRTCGTNETAGESVQKTFDYCDIGHMTCVQEQQELVATAQLSADKLQAESPFLLNVVLSDPDATITRSVLEGDSMYMGTLPALIEQTDAGVWQGSALVGSCTEANMIWAWVLNVEHEGNTLTYRFLFEVTR